jgi:LysR family transcriptional regulator, hydrogen peroxide-inducible genes activator
VEEDISLIGLIIFNIATDVIYQNMNLQQLEYVVALHKHKHFSKAADACHVTQATLSAMVKKLEDEIGMVLFDRSSAPVMTTDRGLEVVNEATQLLAHAQRIKSLGKDEAGKVAGELKLGIIPTIAGSLLGRVIPSLLDIYPELKIHIQEITTANIVNKLKNNELDVGIVSTPLEINHLEEEVLYYEKLMVYGHSASVIEKYKSPKELMYEKIWLLEEGNCLTDQIINVCELSKRKINDNLNFYPSSFDSLLSIVDSFQGLTLIPELYVLDLPPERKRLIRDFQDPYPVREISLVYFRPYVKQHLVKVLAQQIKERLAPLLQTSMLCNHEMMIARM